MHVLVTDWRSYQPVRVGVHVACALRALFKGDWDTKRLDWLLKDEASADAILAGETADDVIAGWQKALRTFTMRRRAFLLYE